MKITFTTNYTFISRFTENNFAKSRFTATMEITIHEEKISHFTFHEKKKNGPITSHENTLYHPLKTAAHQRLPDEISVSYHCHLHGVMLSKYHDSSQPLIDVYTDMPMQVVFSEKKKK